MARLLVHAGFHKTGTTSVQKTLRKNRAALRPHLRVVLRAGMIALCEAARAYSVSRSEWDLGLVKYEAAALLEGMAPSGTVLLSSEDLAGFIPGRRGLRRYDATPRLMAALEVAFRAAWPGADLSLIFTLRAPEAWLASCHTQHVRATRMVLSRKDYIRKYRASADLGAVLEEIAAKLPNTPLHRIALEDCTGRLGPAGPLLDLAGVPEAVQDQLIALPAANTAPSPEKLRRLLALNRSDLSEEAFAQAKRALNREPF